MTDYTQAELMVTAAAREIHDGDVAFVGMRLPLLGFLLAQATHAPNALGVYELGILRERPARAPILTMGDLPNLHNSTWCTDTLDVMGMLQKGLVDVSFIGGAQVDRYGNLNTTYVGDRANKFTRLPGSGGACDLASLGKAHIIIMAHEKRRFVERVDYITSPGYGDGGDWRTRVGLPRGGPRSVITTRAVLRFHPETKEMQLATVHPGTTADEVRENTGWALAVADDLSETPAPTEEELALLRQFDPDGFWTGRKS
jgi:glutaconate CoA-transferase subunit B